MITPEYLRDLTDEELLQYASRIEAVVSLASDVAHEFNDLLQALRGYTELALIDTKEDAGSYHYLSNIYHVTKVGSDLTKRLLTLGKPFEREPEKRKLIKNINKEILKTKEIIERSLPERISLEFDLQDGLDPICIDPYHIEQTLINLTLNSIEALPDGGNIKIKSGIVDLDESFCSRHKYVYPGRHVFISVIDNGIGIKEPMLGYVFDPFFSTKSKKTKGSLISTGLGLSVVDRIVKRYKGTITIESTHNEFTRVTIYIPATTIVETIEECKECEDVDIRTGTEKILVVDDSDHARSATISMLQKFGYDVIGAWSAGEGLRFYKTKHTSPKLAIVDLVMPVMSGKQLLLRVKELGKEHKIIITSGYDLNHSQRSELYAQGASAILNKPYTTSKLLKTVRKVLDEET